jgi:hypothetical protein
MLTLAGLSLLQIDALFTMGLCCRYSHVASLTHVTTGTSFFIEASTEDKKSFMLVAWSCAASTASAQSILGAAGQDFTKLLEMVQQAWFTRNRPQSLAGAVRLAI